MKTLETSHDVKIKQREGVVEEKFIACIKAQSAGKQAEYQKAYAEYETERKTLVQMRKDV